MDQSKLNKLKLPSNIPSISTGLFGYMGYEISSTKSIFAIINWARW